MKWLLIELKGPDSDTIQPSLALNGCTNNNLPAQNTSKDTSSLSAADACKQLEIKTWEINRLMDIVIDEVDDAVKIQLLGPEFKEAGIALQDIYRLKKIPWSRQSAKWEQLSWSSVIY